MASTLCSRSLQTEPESKILSYVAGLLEDTVLTRDLSQQELQITSTLEPCPLFQGSFPPFAYTFCRLPLNVHFPHGWALLSVGSLKLLQFLWELEGPTSVENQSTSQQEGAGLRWSGSRIGGLGTS